jgi:hypothetical protein
MVVAVNTNAGAQKIVQPYNISAQIKKKITLQEHYSETAQSEVH